MTGEAKSVEWNRAWMSWMALAGCVLTYGDALDSLPAELMDVYMRVLPPLSRPGRPVDILENDPFMVWATDGGQPRRADEFGFHGGLLVQGMLQVVRGQQSEVQDDLLELRHEVLPEQPGARGRERLF